LCKKREINVKFGLDLVEVRPDKKEAVFKRVIAQGDKKLGDIEVEKYDFLHVTPPQGPHQFIRESGLGNAAGWVDVNQGTLQHVRHPNVFGLGDCTSVPTPKTAAGVGTQFIALRQNVEAFLNGRPTQAVYDGYTSCPIPIGGSKLLLAEFDYSGQPLPTFGIDPSKARYSYYFLKAHILPDVYWRLVQGRYRSPAVIRRTVVPIVNKMNKFFRRQ